MNADLVSPAEGKTNVDWQWRKKAVVISWGFVACYGNRFGSSYAVMFYVDYFLFLLSHFLLLPLPIPTRRPLAMANISDFRSHGE